MLLPLVNEDPLGQAFKGFRGQQNRYGLVMALGHLEGAQAVGSEACLLLDPALQLHSLCLVLVSFCFSIPGALRSPTSLYFGDINMFKALKAELS